MADKLKNDVLLILRESMTHARPFPGLIQSYPLATCVTHLSYAEGLLRRQVDLRSRWGFMRREKTLDPRFRDLAEKALSHSAQIKVAGGESPVYWAELACVHACEAIGALHGALWGGNRAMLLRAVGSAAEVFRYHWLARAPLSEEYLKSLRYLQSLARRLTYIGNPD